MIRESPELKSVMERVLTAFENRDESTLRGMFDSAQHTLIIGSDPREWHYGATALDLIGTQVGGMPDYYTEIHELVAYESGWFGWASCKSTARFESGATVPLRYTAVFHLTSGAWKVVHWHASEPHPNDPDVMGIELTDTLARLMRTIDHDVENRELRERFPTSTITVVFSDIVNSTKQNSAIGDFAWGDLITRHFSEVERIATKWDGALIKTLGDGAMMAFGSARNAAYASIEIQRSMEEIDPSGGLQLRMGINTGDAMRIGADYFGQMVNAAARIASAALPGQILVADVVFGLISGSGMFRFGDPLSVELKGIEGVKTLFPLEIETTLE